MYSHRPFFSIENPQNADTRNKKEATPLSVSVRDAIGVRCGQIDTATGKPMSHDEVWDRAIEYLGGLDAVACYIPFPLEDLVRSYRMDKNFNHGPARNIRIWTLAAGFVRRGSTVAQVGRGSVWDLYEKHGVNSASPSDGVCLLKRAAARLSEKALENQKKSL